MGTLKELIRPYYLRYLYFKLYPDKIPTSFLSCWKNPFLPLTGHSLPAQISHPDSRGNIIFYPMNDWHTRIQRSQQLARSMTRLGFTAFYLNPHLGRQFDTPFFQDQQHRLSILEEHLYELHVRLRREPVFHHRMLSSEETATIAGAVRSILPTGGHKPGMQIVSLPIWLDAALRIRDQFNYPILYDCHDLLEGFKGYSADIQTAEHMLLEEADLLCFSSAHLLAHHTANNPAWAAKSMLVRNAVDDWLLERVQPDKPPSREPVVGYIGAIEEWLDIDMIRKAAIDLPGCRFVFFGKVDSRHISEQLQLPNIEFKGEIKFSSLPDTLNQLDVGIIPFKVNSLTLSTNPIKLYEYFGYGLPVVSSDLPEVAAFDELVYITRSPADFSSKLKAALDERDPALRQRRRAIAANQTWLQRAQAITSVLKGD